MSRNIMLLLTKIIREYEGYHDYGIPSFTQQQSPRQSPRQPSHELGMRKTKHSNSRQMTRQTSKKRSQSPRSRRILKQPLDI